MIAITHGHGDHVGDTVELSQRFPDAEIVCQVELKKWLARKGANVGDIPGLNKGGTQVVDGIAFTLTDAKHSSSDDETGQYLGEACGFVITLEDGVPIYFAGDTCVFGDMQLIRAPLRAAARRAADRRPLHDGPARGRDRARHARPAALRAVPLGHVPAADRHAGRARRAGRRVRVVEESSPATRSRSERVTYSIAACDLDAGQWGVATQSKFLAVGSVVPWAEPHVGAIATQAYANPRYGPEGLRLLRGGLGAQEVMENLVYDGRRPRAPAARRRRRAAASRASYTGSECMDWAGGDDGAGLRGAGEHPRLRATTVDALAELVHRLGGRAARRAAARRARRRAGRRAATAAASSRRRCSSSRATAATPASRTSSSTCASTTTPPRSTSCAASTSMHQLLFGKTPADEWLDVDDDLAARAARAPRAARLRRPARRARSTTGPGTENLEERVNGVERIDPVVLEELRKR